MKYTQESLGFLKSELLLCQIQQGCSSYVDPPLQNQSLPIAAEVSQPEMRKTMRNKYCKTSSQWTLLQKFVKATPPFYVHFNVTLEILLVDWIVLCLLLGQKKCKHIKKKNKPKKQLLHLIRKSACTVCHEYPYFLCRNKACLFLQHDLDSTLNSDYLKARF